MAEVTHLHAANETQFDSTSDGTYVDVTSMSVSPTNGTKYLILALCQATGNSASDDIWVRVTGAGSTLETKSELRMESSGATRFHPYFFVHSFTSDGSAVKLQVHSEGGSQVSVDQCILILIDLDDLGSANYYEDINAATSTDYPKASAGGTKLATIAGSNLGTTKEWLLLGCVRTGSMGTNTNHRIELLGADDASTQTALLRYDGEGEGSGETRVTGLVGRHKAVTSNVDAEIYADTDGNATSHDDQGSYLIAIDTSAFADFEHSWLATAEGITSTEETLRTVGPYTPTTGGNHLILGAMNRNSEGSVGGGKLFVEDGTTEIRTGDSSNLQGELYDATDKPIALVMNRYSFSASTTLNLRVIGPSSTSHDVENYGLFVLNLNLAASGDTTATPTTAAFTTTAPAVTLSAGSTVTPTTAAYTATAPAATASAASTATPTTAVYTATAPAATASAGSTVTPASAALTATAPPVTLSAGSTVTPTTAAYTVSAPAAVPDTATKATPASAALTVTADTPSVSASSTVTVTAAALTVTAPAATASAGSTSVPVAAALTLSCPAATASAGAAQAPVAAPLSLAAPSITVSAGSTVTPTTAALTVTAPAAVPDTSGDATATPASAALALTAPAATASAGSTVTPTTAALTVTAPAAVPDTSAGATATPASAALTVTAPAATASAGSTVTPASAAYTATAPATVPQTSSDTTATPTTAALALFSDNPLTAAGAVATPAAAELVVFVPAATASAASTVTLTTAAFTVTAPLSLVTTSAYVRAETETTLSTVSDSVMTVAAAASATTTSFIEGTTDP